MLAVISCVFSSYVSAEHMFTNISKFVAPHGAKLAMHRLSPSVGGFQHLPERKNILTRFLSYRKLVCKLKQEHTFRQRVSFRSDILTLS